MAGMISCNLMPVVLLLVITVLSGVQGTLVLGADNRGAATPGLRNVPRFGLWQVKSSSFCYNNIILISVPETCINCKSSVHHDHASVLSKHQTEKFFIVLFIFTDFSFFNLKSNCAPGYL